MPTQPYVQYSFTAAATGRDTLLLSFRHDPGWDAIDNVVVTEVGGVPEPATAAMALVGLCALSGALRKRSRPAWPAPGGARIRRLSRDSSAEK